MKQSIRNHSAAALAGALGTLAMDLVWYRRYRDDGGHDTLWRWESGAGVSGWNEASAPGQLGGKLLHLVSRRQPPDEWARATTNAVHWTTGVAWGLQYAALARRRTHHPLVLAAALGPTAWASAYVLMPLAKIYKPIWEYDGRTLAKDLSAHMVFGAATSATFAALARR